MNGFTSVILNVAALRIRIPSRADSKSRRYRISEVRKLSVVGANTVMVFVPLSGLGPAEFNCQVHESLRAPGHRAAHGCRVSRLTTDFITQVGQGHPCVNPHMRARPSQVIRAHPPGRLTKPNALRAKCVCAQTLSSYRPTLQITTNP